MGNNYDRTFRIYPRGFLGGNLKPRIVQEPDSFLETVKNRYSVKTHDDNDGSIVSNPAVDYLYADYIKNNINTSTGTFRHQILKTALSAFGTGNFLVWFLAQQKSPAYGDLHHRFLVDTMQFINTGRRELSLESWDTLLNIKAEQVSATNKRDKINEFFGAHGNDDLTLSSKKNIYIVDVIQNWCIQPGGLEDLLSTLHILFGIV